MKVLPVFPVGKIEGTVEFSSVGTDYELLTVIKVPVNFFCTNMWIVQTAPSDSSGYPSSSGVIYLALCSDSSYSYETVLFSTSFSSFPVQYHDTTVRHLLGDAELMSIYVFGYLSDTADPPATQVLKIKFKGYAYGGGSYGIRYPEVPWYRTT